LKLHAVKGTEKRAIEHTKRFNDYQSAGLITFLISSPQHPPPLPNLIEICISKNLTFADLKAKATQTQRKETTNQYDTIISSQNNSQIVY